MRVVVALGGNALIRRGESAEAPAQARNVELAAAALAGLCRDHDLVVTHGNGPQVGLLALQAAAYHEVQPYPLDMLGAETEGLIGYLLEQALRSHLAGREVATVLTQVEVDPRDPAFEHPTKPIGPVYDAAAADETAARTGWSMAREGGGFRRVVASPEPVRILEMPAIEALLAAGILVVCAGGGGVPVTVHGRDAIRGVEAVVDKDLSASLLARQLRADALLLLTDVDSVWTEWRSPNARQVAGGSPAALRRLDLPAGSMGPKVEAAARFAEESGRAAYIGPLSAPGEVLAGSCGTRVHLDEVGLRLRPAGQAPPPPTGPD